MPQQEDKGKNNANSFISLELGWGRQFDITEGKPENGQTRSLDGIPKNMTHYTKVRLGDEPYHIQLRATLKHWRPCPDHGQCTSQSQSQGWKQCHTTMLTWRKTRKGQTPTGRNKKIGHTAQKSIQEKKYSREPIWRIETCPEILKTMVNAQADAKGENNAIQPRATLKFQDR